MKRYLPPALLAILLLTVYGTTMAPGLTWANNGADGGDLITAAATGGVAHPTGYPLYLLIARSFQILPIGSLAYRTNLMSAVFMTLAAVLVYEVVRRELESRPTRTTWLAGFASGFAFGLAPLAWSQAVITEVYALNAFLVALLLYLSSIRDASADPVWLDRLGGLIFGLALGNHLTFILLAPIWLTPFIRRGSGESSQQAGRGWLRGWQVEGPVLMRRLSWMCAGLLIYLTLPLRAGSHPPVNWGNPIGWEGFWWLVSGRLYQDELVFSLPHLWERMQAWVEVLLAQAGLPGLLMGFVGLVFHSSALRPKLLWIAIPFLLFSVLYGTVDSFVYLIPLVLCLAVWIGLGLGGWMEAAAQRWRPGGAFLGVLALAYLAALAVLHRPQVDASHDPRAEQFGEAVMVQAPAGALVFAKGDQAVFALWYYHYALGERPDLAVVAPDLLHFEWYLETLRSTYPGLVLPGPLPWAESLIAANPARPYCYVQNVQWMDIRCTQTGQP